MEGEDRSPFFGRGTIPESSHAEGATLVSKTVLQRDRRVEWKDGSFHIMAGILSKPGVLLFLIGLRAAHSSSRVNGSVEMGSGSENLFRGKGKVSPADGGGWPNSLEKWPDQFSKRLGVEPPFMVMEGLLFLPVIELIVFHAAVCFFSL